jgi:hypothetical protein
MKIVLSSDPYIIAHSIGEIKDYTDYDLRGTSPRAEIGGIYDEYVFGLPFKCRCGGVSAGKCPICGITAYDEETYLNNYAYYHMSHVIVTNLKLASLIKKLASVGIRLPKFDKDALISLYSTAFKLYEVVEGSEAEKEDKKKEMYLVHRETNKKYIFKMEEIEKDTPVEEIGTEGLNRLIEYTINGKPLDFLAEHLNAVLPIISPGLRKAKFPMINGSIKKQFPEIHFEYKSLIYMDKFCYGVEHNLKLSSVDKATVMYLFNKMYNQHTANSSLLKPAKESLVRSSISSRVGASIRWNAASYQKAKLNEVYVPRSGAYHALQAQIIDALLKEENMERYDAMRLYEKQDKRAIIAFQNIMDNAVALVCRNPTLQRNNLMAFKPIIWDEPAIGVNGLIAKSYNLDFDGDQLAVYFVTDDKQKELLDSRMNVENLWVFDKTHEPAFVPNPTCLYGLYCATIIKKHKDPRKFDKFESIEEAFNKGEIEVDDQIILMPNKSTTYGREKISRILGVDIDLIIELDALDQKKLVRVIAGLIDRPNRAEIITQLRDFGNEIATLVGIDVLPTVNLYKNMSPELDKVLQNDKLSEEVKLKKVTEMVPSLLRREIKKLPDSNVDILLSGSRINTKTLQSLYTPYIRLDSKGKVKIGDSALVEGLSEEEYISAIHTQREILGVKREAIPRGGFNQTQLVLASLNFKYSKEVGKTNSYVFVPEKEAKERVILKDIKSDIPGYVAVKSTASNNSAIVYRDEVSDTSAKILADQSRIGTNYAKAITEFMTQSQLSLKYGALLNDFINEDIRALKSGEVEEVAEGDDGYMVIGGLKYRLGHEIKPSEEVINRKYIKEGDVIAINANLLNVNYRLANFISLLDMKVVTNKLYELSNYHSHKEVSYAYKDGVVTYKNGKIYLDDKIIGTIDNKTTYFIPEGYKVKYGDRISSAVLDLPALLKLTDKEHAFYLFYLNLNKVAKSSTPLNMDLAEVIFKLLVTSDFSIKKKMTNQKDFITRLAYGSTKKGIKDAVTNLDNLDEDMETNIGLSEDNPLLKLMLRK